MKLVIFLFLCYTFSANCYPKKIVPIDKNANVAFINMEAGGTRPNNPPAKPLAPVSQPTTTKPAAPTNKPLQVPAPAQNQNIPAKASEAIKPVAIPTPHSPTKPSPNVTSKPAQIQPKPVNPPPASNPITTPGPGSVKQLITFYDSQGKASPIRPYSYSQAVKQG